VLKKSFRVKTENFKQGTSVLAGSGGIGGAGAFPLTARGQQPSGRRPSLQDLPIEQPTKFELVINLRQPERSASLSRRRCSTALTRRISFATSEFGTFRTSHDVRSMSAFRGNSEAAIASPDFRS